MSFSGNVAESHCVPILAPRFSPFREAGEPIAVQKLQQICETRKHSGIKVKAERNENSLSTAFVRKNRLSLNNEGNPDK
jgi:hypothetical protein